MVSAESEATDADDVSTTATSIRSENDNGDFDNDNESMASTNDGPSPLIRMTSTNSISSIGANERNGLFPTALNTSAVIDSWGDELPHWAIKEVRTQQCLSLSAYLESIRDSQCCDNDKDLSLSKNTIRVSEVPRFLPLIIDEEHASRALPLLKEELVRLDRIVNYSPDCVSVSLDQNAVPSAHMALMHSYVPMEIGISDMNNRASVRLRSLPDTVASEMARKATVSIGNNSSVNKKSSSGSRANQIASRLVSAGMSYSSVVTSKSNSNLATSPAVGSESSIGRIGQNTSAIMTGASLQRNHPIGQLTSGKDEDNESKPVPHPDTSHRWHLPKFDSVIGFRVISAIMNGIVSSIVLKAEAGEKMGRDTFTGIKFIFNATNYA
jgi:hypothetical protein